MRAGRLLRSAHQQGAMTRRTRTPATVKARCRAVVNAVPVAVWIAASSAGGVVGDAGAAVRWVAIVAAACGGTPSAARLVRTLEVNACWTTVPNTATPKTAPSWRAVLLIAEARPARGGGTEVTMVADSGASMRPKPMPKTVRRQVIASCGVVRSRAVRLSRPAPARAAPRTTGARKPQRAAMRVAIGA